MTLILAMGLVGDAPPTYADGLQVLTTMEGFMYWDQEAIE